MVRQYPLMLTLLLLLVGVAGFLTLRGLGFWRDSDVGQVRPLPKGDQEIAVLLPATNTEGWERFVSALRLLAEEWGNVHDRTLPLRISTENAFLPRSVDVSELALSMAASENKLWIRWYKLSGLNDARRWITLLHQRTTAPLAIIGGDTTDRALDVATVLKEFEPSWAPRTPPLFLITTATADRYLPREKAIEPNAVAKYPYAEWPKLMSLYPGRSFRYSFTNNRMAEAVLDFLRAHPEVWLERDRAQTAAQLTQAILGMFALPYPLAVMGEPGPLRPSFTMSTLWWRDDGYSRDMSESFSMSFRDMTGPNNTNLRVLDVSEVEYSVGDFYNPNPRERSMITLFIDQQHDAAERPPQLLVLPTGAQRVRRVVRDLCRQAPASARRLVIANGDAISFNTVFRDRDLAWNILDLPVPLVFFSHRNPISRSAGFDPSNPKALTSTQDLLFYRDLLESICHAAFDRSNLLADSDAMRRRLEKTLWHQHRVRNRIVNESVQEALDFFDAEGNRKPGTGEFICWLAPHVSGPRNLDEASLSAWYYDATKNHPSWKLLRDPLPLTYNRIVP
jgi:hypothetical protein